MKFQKTLNQIRLRRKKRVRAKIYGTADKPRLSIFRSNKYTYIQLIDDEKGKTLISASTKELQDEKEKEKKERKKIDQATALGELIAKKALEKGVKKAILDRGQYKYHGRIKAVAEGVRKGGLQL